MSEVINMSEELERMREIVARYPHVSGLPRDAAGWIAPSQAAREAAPSSCAEPEPLLLMRCTFFGVDITAAMLHTAAVAAELGFQFGASEQARADARHLAVMNTAARLVLGAWPPEGAAQAS